MKLKDLFKELIEVGIEKDPRDKKAVLRVLSDIKKSYAELSEKEKKFFDMERTKNPYMDSRIFFGKGTEEIKRVMVGIDIETPELLLFDRLRQKGEKIDLAIAHHPEGLGLSNMARVMTLHTDMMQRSGVPINVAENIMTERIQDVSKNLMPANYSRAVDAARLLNIPFIGVHTPADNCVSTYLEELFAGKKPEKLKDILDLLLDIEEYRISYKDNNSPKILVGSKDSHCGKIYVDMTGGTEGPAVAIDKLANAGVGTIVGMHLGEAHIKKAKENNINVLIAGHVSSDTLGLNLLFDEVEARLGALDFVCCSGFQRIRRK